MCFFVSDCCRFSRLLDFESSGWSFLAPEWILVLLESELIGVLSDDSCSQDFDKLVEEIFFLFFYFFAYQSN